MRGRDGNDCMVNTSTAAALLGVSYMWMVEDRHGDRRIPSRRGHDGGHSYRLVDILGYVTRHGRPLPDKNMID